MKKYLTVIALIFSVYTLNIGITKAQSFHEVGLFETTTSIAVSKILGNNSVSTKVKIYQSSSNIVKYDIPQMAYVKIGIYDKSNNLVRTYIYNNMQAGTYELNFTSGNLNKGMYTCVLNASGVSESAMFSIE
jgi:hypothetical protein